MKALNLKISAGLLAMFVSTTAPAMEIAFESDDRLPIVYLNVAIHGGAVEDPLDQSGLTNLMGEMLLRGTLRHSKDQIDTMLDEMGASIEVETRSELLIIRGVVVARELPAFLALLTEIIGQPAFSEAELKKVKEKTVSELMTNLQSDGYVASVKFGKFLFGSHPYANPVNGTIAGVKKVTRDAINKQYQRLLVQERLLVIGTGDSNLATIKTWAEEMTKGRPSGVAATPLPKADGPSKRMLFVVDKPERTQLQIMFGQIGLTALDSDYFAMAIANQAFGGPVFSARFMQEIRVKRGWSYGAYSNMKLASQPHSLRFNLAPANKNGADALALSLKMVQDLKDIGLTTDEYRFSKESLINNSGFRFNTPKKRVENTLIEQSLGLPSGFIRNMASSLEKVKFEDVNKALKNRIHPDKMVITVVATAKEQKAALAKAAGVAEKDVLVVPYNE